MKRAWILIAGTVAALAFPLTAAWAPCHRIEFSPTAYTVGEAAGKVTLTVTNGGGAQTQDQMVDYTTVNGTAKSPMDYTHKSGTVTWTVGASSDVTIDIPIKNDTIDEPAERFTVKLSNVRPPSSCVTPPSITGDTATVTIADNDKPKPKPSHTPTPTPTQSAASTPTPKKSSPSPSPSPSASTSPTPTLRAAPPESGGGLSGGALAGIVAGVIVLGGGAAILVRRRFMS